jgi:hypothetical protein
MGASNKVLVVRLAARMIGLLLLLYSSLSFFDGITLSCNPTTDLITIKGEATTTTSTGMEDNDNKTVGTRQKNQIQ